MTDVASDPVAPATADPTPPSAGDPVPKITDLSPIQQSALRANIAKMQQHGATPDELDAYIGGALKSAAPKPQQISMGAGIAASADEGASFGFSPKILAGIEATRETLPTWLAGEGKTVASFPDRYGKLRDQADAATTQFAQDNPKTHAAAELGGALATGGILSGGMKAAGITNLIDQGATGGVIAGAGYGRGNPLQYADNIAKNAALGAAAAPAVGAAADMTGAIGSRLANMGNLRPISTLRIPGTNQPLPINSVGDEAKQIVLKRLAESGLTPSTFAAQATASGKPMAIADVGVPMQRLARTVNTASPVASQTLSDAFGPRQSDAVERVLSDVAEHTNQSGQPSAHLTDQQLVAQRSADANTAYGPVFADQTPIADPEIEKIFGTPAGKKAAANADVMMANKGIPVARQPAVRTLPTALIDPKTGQPLTVTGLTNVETPTIQQLHYRKLAFDDLINSNSSEPGEGGLGYNNKATVIGLKNQLVDRMRANNPGYDAARSQYADQSDLLDALREGGDHFSRSPEQSSDLMASMAPAQQELYTRGALGSLRAQLGAMSPARDVTAKVGSSAPSVSQQQLKLLFPSDDAFDAWKAKVANESKMAQTGRTTFGGSNTADKLSDLADLSGITPRAVVSTMAGNPKAFVMSLARQAVKDRSLGYSRNLSDAIAPMISAGAKNPADRDAVVQSLEDYLRKNPPGRTPLLFSNAGQFAPGQPTNPPASTP